MSVSGLVEGWCDRSCDLLGLCDVPVDDSVEADREVDVGLVAPEVGFAVSEHVVAEVVRGVARHVPESCLHLAELLCRPSGVASGVGDGTDQ